MPEFINRDRPEQVQPLEGEAAERAFLSGQFGIVDKRVNVRGPDGRVNSIPKEQLQGALSSGKYHFATRQEVDEQARRDHFDTTSQALAAGLESVVSGATLGLSTVLGAALGDKEAQAARREFFPGITTVGELGGAIVPALATGGASVAARAARGAAFAKRGKQAEEVFRAVDTARKAGASEATLRSIAQEAKFIPALAQQPITTAEILAELPAARVARLGDKAQEAVEFASSIQDAPKLIQKTAALGARGAAEGTFFGAGHGMTEAALGDSEGVAEKLMAVAEGAGFGLLAGGIGGGALATAGQAALAGGKISKKGAEVLFRHTFGEASPKAVSSFKDKVKGFWQNARIWRKRPEIMEGIVRKSTVHVGESVKGDQVVTNLSRGKIKPTRIRGLIPRTKEAQAEVTANATEALEGWIRAMRQMADDPALGSPGLMGQIADEFDAALTKAPEDAISRFALADNLKRAVYSAQDDLWKTVKRGNLPAGTGQLRQARTAAERASTLHKGIRGTLQNKALFGEKLANMQIETNAALHNYFGKPGELGSSRLFQSKFLMRDPGTGFVGPDTRKIASHYNGLTNPRTNEAQIVFDRQIQASDDMMDMFDKWYDLSDAERRIIKETKRANAAIRKTQAEAKDTLTAANQYQDLVRADGIGGGTFGTGAILGGVAGGPIGLALGAVGEAALNPGLVARKIASIQGFVDRINTESASSISKFASDAVKGGKKVLRRAVTPAIVKGMAERRKDIEEQRAELQRMSSPQYVAEKMAQDFAGIADVAPKLLQQYAMKMNNAVQLLADKLPPVDPVNVFSFGEPLPLSETEIHRYEEYSRGVLDPVSVIQDISKLTMSPEAIQGLADAYPQMYQDLRQQVMGKLVDGQIQLPYEFALHLGILLDVPTHPSLEPDFLARIQSLPIAPQEEEAEPEAPQRPLQRKSREPEHVRPLSERLGTEV